MDKPLKVTDIVKFLLSQASKDMLEPLVLMFFPSFGAHMSVVKIRYPDHILKEMCSKMVHLVAKSGLSVSPKGLFHGLKGLVSCAQRACFMA